MNYKFLQLKMRFCYIFFCTKKEKEKIQDFSTRTNIFSFPNSKDIFTYSTYLRGYFFFFYFTKIVIIIYIFFFLSNFSPPKTNKTMNEGHEMILRFYFSLLRESAVFMHNFFSFFPLFFESRNTLLDAAQRSQFRRKTNFIDRCIRNPGKNFSHCLKPRSPRVRRREKDREQWRYIIPRFYQRNVSITLLQKSNFIFSTLIFSNIDRSSYRPKRSSKREKGRKERREKYTVTRRMPISPTRGRTCDLSAAIFYRPSHFHWPRESWWLAFTPDSSPSILTNRDQPPFRDNFLKEVGINIYIYIFFFPEEWLDRVLNA